MILTCASYSYQLGLTYLNTQMRRALGTCTLPDLLFEKALALEHKRTDVEQEAYMQQRRKSSHSARRFTQNGSSSAAITRISSSTNSGFHPTAAPAHPLDPLPEPTQPDIGPDEPKNSISFR